MCPTSVRHGQNSHKWAWVWPFRQNLAEIGNELAILHQNNPYTRVPYTITYCRGGKILFRTSNANFIWIWLLLLSNCQDGPDILVCDEAHMIKNTKADITQALKQVKCQRRIALTGSPLQNNLMEYYCVSIRNSYSSLYIYIWYSLFVDMIIGTDGRFCERRFPGK